MSEIQRGTHLPPGEGESVWLVGNLIEVKLASEDTGGAYSMVEVTSPPQGGPPPHIQHNEDEALYVVEGEVEVLVGDRTTRASAGSLAYVLFLESGEPAPEGSFPPEGEPDVGRIVEISQKYGLEIPPPPGQ